MAEDLFIPKLGQTVEEVVLINWLVVDGAKVDFGDPVLEVETDKAIFNVEANAKGFVHFGPYEIGETVPVLTVVATIGKADEAFSPKTVGDLEESEEEAALPQKQEEKLQTPEGEEQLPQAPVEKLFASPRAKKLAAKEGVDLAKISPTGGEGIRIIEQDVVDYLQQKPKTTPLAAAFAKEVGLDTSGLVGTGPQGALTRSDIENEIRSRLSQAADTGAAFNKGVNIPYQALNIREKQPLSPIRKRIFERMSQSVHTTARVTLTTEADVTDLVALRETLVVEKTETWGFKIGYNDLIGIILVQALKEFSYMNARLSQDGKAYEYLDEVNLGIAVDTERGLLVPVIKKADRLRLEAFGKKYRELVEKTLSGKASSDDLTGGTFTLTNLGYYDIDAFTPVINLPEVAILGLGRIQDKVIPYQAGIAVRKMITLSLVFDHRLIDGAPAAKFLQSLKESLEAPSKIID
ncbi:MAG TPA: dihydrolipoamide acetyltransferase family protein [Brevefilum sp.]